MRHGEILHLQSPQACVAAPRTLAAGLAFAGAQARLRRGHRRRRRARLGHGLLLGQGAGRQQRGRAGERLSGRRQHRPQHHHRALQLSARRSGPPLRFRAATLGRLEPRTELQRHVQPARRAQSGPYVAGHARHRTARQRESLERHRRRSAQHGRGSREGAADELFAERPLSGTGARPGNRVAAWRGTMR